MYNSLPQLLGAANYFPRQLLKWLASERERSRPELSGRAFSTESVCAGCVYYTYARAN